MQSLLSVRNGGGGREQLFSKIYHVQIEIPVRLCVSYDKLSVETAPKYQCLHMIKAYLCLCPIQVGRVPGPCCSRKESGWGGFYVSSPQGVPIIPPYTPLVRPPSCGPPLAAGEAGKSIPAVCPGSKRKIGKHRLESAMFLLLQTFSQVAQLRWAVPKLIFKFSWCVDRR